MAETRKIAAILAADGVGFSRMTCSDEDRTLARLRALRTDLIDPIIASQNGRVFKRTGDGSLVEFRSVVEAVRCAVSVQNAMAERNVGTPEDQRIVFRIGIHLGDVVEESDGDLMGDGVNIAARLEGIAEPGAICLSEDAYRQVRARLDFPATDLGPTQLKNIAHAIRVYSLEIGKPVPSAPPPSAAAALQRQSPPRLSLVVLPLANIGGGAEQDYFVDGVTESLTTDLSRISGALVIGRNTAFTYKGKAVDLKQIGRELNVRYVLEGSVQRGGNRMRVNVQLIDAETGHHLWAERFDKPLGDLFDMQDEIVARLAGALNTELVAAEARRAEKVLNPDAMDLHFQGMAWLNKGYTPHNTAQARGHFDRALLCDANNVEALVGSARADAISGSLLYVGDPKAALAAAEAKLNKALSLVSDHARGHLVLGWVYMVTKRAARGLAECEYSLVLDRNLAQAHAFISTGKIMTCRFEDAEAHIAEALRLSPRDAFVSTWIGTVGIAKNFLGLWDQAIPWLQRSIEAERNNPLSHFMLGVAFAWLGQLSEARTAVGTGLALNPAFSICSHRALYGSQSDDPIYLAAIERLYEGMRMAGVPEH